MRNQLRTVKSEQSDMKPARLGQPLHVTCLLVFGQMGRQIIQHGVEHALLPGDTIRIRPELPFVLIAPRAGVYEIGLVIGATG